MPNISLHAVPDEPLRILGVDPTHAFGSIFPDDLLHRYARRLAARPRFALMC